MSAALDEPHTVQRLPQRPAIHPGQALDSYLEHVAAANHMTPFELAKKITRAADTTRFLMLAPTEATLRSLTALTGQPGEQLKHATLKHFDGAALDLSGLDPHNQASYRTVAGRGWLPGNSSQMCPRCLKETSGWQLAWRLPTTTVCTKHRRYLIGTCPGCNKPFRTAGHGFIRLVGASLVCGNPDGARGRHCRTELTTLTAKRADPACVGRQERYDRAMVDGVATVFGHETCAGAYHRALRSLTVLLLHISTVATGPQRMPPWARRLNQGSSLGTIERAPRWGLAPPHDPAVRSRVLTTADEILGADDLHAAARLLDPWAGAIPRTPDGFLGWVGDHMVPDPLATHLVMAAHAPRRRLSRALDDIEAVPRRLEDIPQVIPQDLYDRYLIGMCGARRENVRTFAALCLARAHPGVDTWSHAAQALGLNPEIGRRTAQTCTSSMKTVPSRFVDALMDLASHLPDRNYRVGEQRVRDLERTDDWFTTWVQEHRLGTRPSSKTHVVTWLWTVTAHGHISTSPGAPRTLDARGRAYYRRFAQSLTPDQQTALSRAMESRA